MIRNHANLNMVALALGIGLFAATRASAATVTAADVSAAATNTDASDLGDKSITIGDLTIASTGTSPDDRNLGYETFGGGSVESIGVFEGNSNKHGAVGLGEELTLSFATAKIVQSIILTDHGNDDGTAYLTGFASDPGASVSGLPAGWTVTYNAGTDAVQIASNGSGGYRSSYVINFANEVPVTQLILADPAFLGGGPGGVGFGAITYVPTPASLAMGLLGLPLIAARRRRR